jgi:hypothetical protein
MATLPATPESPPLGLSRTAGHIYSFNSGSEVFAPLPSVTTVIGVIDKSGPLLGWAKREVSNAALRNLDVLSKMVVTAGPESAARWLATIPGYQRDSAADIGTRIHRLVEQLARGTEPEVTAEEAPFVDGYRRFLAAYQPRFLALEEMVASLRHRYAGTLDAIAVIGGETWILDVKTGSGIYPETALQLAGYANADFIGRPGTPRRFRLPRATRFGVIHVRPEGARLVEYHVGRDTYAAFLEARRLYAWQQGAAKTAVGAVVTATGRSAAA